MRKHALENVLRQGFKFKGFLFPEFSSSGLSKFHNFIYYFQLIYLSKLNWEFFEQVFKGISRTIVEKNYAAVYFFEKQSEIRARISRRTCMIIE